MPSERRQSAAALRYRHYQRASADVNHLIDAFVFEVRNRQQPPSFTTFRSIWQLRSFSMIHETKISSEKPWEFAQRLFLSALDVLDFKPVPQCGSGALGTAGGHGNQARAAVAAPQQPAGMPHPDLDPESLARASMEFLTSAGPNLHHVGAVYALHGLYHSQHMRCKTRIYLSPEHVRSLTALVRSVRGLPAYADVVRILSSLEKTDAFVYGAMHASLKALPEREGADAVTLVDARILKRAAEHLQRVSRKPVAVHEEKSMKRAAVEYMESQHEIRQAFDSRSSAPPEHAFSLATHFLGMVPERIALEQSDMLRVVDLALSAARRGLRESFLAFAPPSRLAEFRKLMVETGRIGGRAKAAKAGISRQDRASAPAPPPGLPPLQSGPGAAAGSLPFGLPALAPGALPPHIPPPAPAHQVDAGSAMPLPPLLMPLDVSAPAAEPAATGAGQGRAPAAGLTEEEVAQAIDDFLAEYGGEEEDYGEDDLSDEVSDLEELPELRPPLVLGD